MDVHVHNKFLASGGLMSQACGVCCWWLVWFGKAYLPTAGIPVQELLRPVLNQTVPWLQST